MELEERIQVLEDKLAIKQLVDTYSILMDEKNGTSLKGLFTPDGSIRNYIGEELKLTLNGPEEIGNAYSNYLNTLDSTFHMNGQQVLNIKGDRALGRSYCQITIVETKNGAQITTLQNTYYDDEFRKVEGKWLFVKRNCHYVMISTK